MNEMTPRELFKEAIKNEVKQTGYANCDQWLDYYSPDGLTAQDALDVVYELASEEGFNIEDDPHRSLRQY